MFARSAGRIVSRAAMFGTLLVLGGCNSEPKWRGTAVLPVRDLPIFSFTDSSSHSITTAPSKGSVSLLFFGYTNCPDVCGTTLADWARVKRALGDHAKHVRFLFVTIDPARDTPAVTQRFVSQFDSTFKGLSGDSATTGHMQRAFGVASQPIAASSGSAHLLAHSSQTYLVDDRGRLLVMYAYGAGWDTMAADIKQLLN